MAKIRVLGVQQTVAPGKKDNLPRILERLEQAQADLVIFPEMALTGPNGLFHEQRTRDAWSRIATVCRQRYLAAVIGTGIRENGHVYIQSRVYGPEGNLIGTYEKLIPTESERKWARPGEQLPVFMYRGVPFGCLIGNDLWVRPGCGPYPDPRLTLQLAKKGARLIIHTTDTETDPRFSAFYDANLRLRAWEANAWIVTVNAANLTEPLNVPSGVISPDGEWACQAPRVGEHLFTWDLEFPDLEET
ncbi:MAG TPA: carbon-nitrogen hydrolase family protein [Candidatus Hydrogenedentes bacterium]|nr:carbon-nitrogen hydrolase family protein [Candidatus Hydrogenedentota bacterium]